MMRALLFARAHPHNVVPVPIGPRFFHRPAKTSSVVLVHGLEYQQHGAYLEDGGTYEGGDSSADEYLVVEFGGGRHDREPDKERVYDPHTRAEGENGRNEVGDVPVGTLRKHADDSSAGLTEGGCLLRCDVRSRLGGRRGQDF